MNNDVLKETVKQLLEDINVSNDKIKSLLKNYKLHLYFQIPFYRQQMVLLVRP